MAEYSTVKIRIFRERRIMLNQKIAVIDVETPNCNNDSICSIGIVIIDKGKITDSEYHLINPQTHFDSFNTKLTGIDEDVVANFSTLPEVWKDIEHYFSSYLLVGHNFSFDLSCIRKALDKYEIHPNPCYFVDTMKIAKELMPNLQNYKLDTLCDFFDIELSNHHNALADCIATAKVLIDIDNSFLLNIDYYIKKYDFSNFTVKSNFTPKYSSNTKYLQELQGLLIGITCDQQLNDTEIIMLKKWIDEHLFLKGNFPFDKIYESLEMALEDNIITDGERTYLLNLYNNIINPTYVDEQIECIDINCKLICLSGDFECMSKVELSSILSQRGAIIKNSVVKSLDYLIVGSKGSDQWIHGNYGSKIKKAMELRAKGAKVEIIKESDILCLIDE